MGSTQNNTEGGVPLKGSDPGPRFDVRNVSVGEQSHIADNLLRGIHLKPIVEEENLSEDAGTVTSAGSNEDLSPSEVQSLDTANGDIKSEGFSFNSKEQLFNTYTERPSLIQKLVSPIAKRGRDYAERKTSRLVAKDGDTYITSQNISDKKSKFLVDLYTTLVDLKWRYTILLFALAFLLSWLIFAVIYFIICIVHGDHLHIDDPDWKPCHSNVYDFTTAFLFSLETQHTIGYGFRGMEPNCVPSMIALAAQSCTGAFFQCIVTGLVFAKLSRPKRRSKTIMFSEKAVIVQRDDELNLLFRVGDMRRTHMIGTSIRAFMVKNRLTKEGELIPFCQHPLTLTTETSNQGENYLFMVWPVTIAHPINKDSPLWDISAEQLMTQHFEIIVIMEGTVSSTGMATQVRTSYLPSEILWGHRLAPLLTYKKDAGGYSIDHMQFHSTVPLIDMVECSAKELAQKRRKGHKPSTEKSDAFINFTASSDSIPSLSKGLLGRRRHGDLPPLHRSASMSPKLSPTSPRSPENVIARTAL